MVDVLRLACSNPLNVPRQAGCCSRGFCSVSNQFGVWLAAIAIVFVMDACYYCSASPVAHGHGRGVG